MRQAIRLRQYSRRTEQAYVTLLFAFVTATAAWLLVHFLNAALLAPQ